MDVQRAAPLAALILAVAVAAGCAQKLESVELRWQPTERIQVTGGVVPGATRVQVMPFTDARLAPKRIGENREGRKAQPVDTRDDVAAFVTAQMGRLLRDRGYIVVDQGGDFVVSGEVLEFFVAETREYRGTVQLRLVVTRPDGREAWSGAVSGSATNFGLSYSLTNYLETLSDALIVAVDHLVRDQTFGAALRRG